MKRAPKKKKPVARAKAPPKKKEVSTQKSSKSSKSPKVEKSIPSNTSARLAAGIERDAPQSKPRRRDKPEPINTKDIMLKLTLEGKTRAELEDAARAFLDEDDTEPTGVVSGEAGATKPRGRGRPRKAEQAAAATSAAVEAAATATPPAAIPGHATKMAEVQAAANAAASTAAGQPSKEAMLEAASKLIDAKGEAFAAALLEKNYKATRFVEIPPHRWAELIAEVKFLLELKPAEKPAGGGLLG